MFKSLKTQAGKSLFSADEIFKQIDTADSEGNVFYQDENNVLSILLEEGNIRNKKNLDFLSGEKQSNEHKIRFTLHLILGFFLIPSTNQPQRRVFFLIKTIKRNRKRIHYCCFAPKQWASKREGRGRRIIGNSADYFTFQNEKSWNKVGRGGVK